jgi:hypothetical protein
MATLALKPAENFLLVAFIIATNFVIFFNLTSGLILGEYYTLMPCTIKIALAKSREFL